MIQYQKVCTTYFAMLFMTIGFATYAGQCPPVSKVVKQQKSTLPKGWIDTFNVKGKSVQAGYKMEGADLDIAEDRTTIYCIYTQTVMPYFPLIIEKNLTGKMSPLAKNWIEKYKGAKRATYECKGNAKRCD